MIKKDSRPPIPQKVQFKLWLAAGGRCEFPGCNDLLYRDGLTLKEVNWSNIAHIISWTPKGPRGDKILSKRLAKEFSNLMLMCGKHAHLIDEKKYIAEYTPEKLRKIKQEHEERIRILTSIGSEMKTHVLLIQSNIGDNPVEINVNEVNTAVTMNGMYPSSVEPFLIDLTGDKGRGSEDYYIAKAKEITQRLGSFIDKFNGSTKRQHISIFPLALMPLLVHLGKELGDKHSIQLFQHNRDEHNWFWVDTADFPEYFSYKPTKITASKDVFLKVALSDYIGEDKLDSLPKLNSNQYEITIKNPTPHFLINRNQLSKFGSVYRHLLNEIAKIHGKDCVVHLLLAAPSPIAVQCGLSLLTRKDPKIVVYDFDNKLKGFIKALEI